MTFEGDLPAEFIELGDQTTLDESDGSEVDTGPALMEGETMAWDVSDANDKAFQDYIVGRRTCPPL